MKGDGARHLPFLSYGFRPSFLVATAWAIVDMVIWVDPFEHGRPAVQLRCTELIMLAIVIPTIALAFWMAAQLAASSWNGSDVKGADLVTNVELPASVEGIGEV